MENDTPKKATNDITAPADLVDKMKAKCLKIKAFVNKIEKEDVWKEKKEKEGVKLKTTKIGDSPLKTAFLKLEYGHQYEDVKHFFQTYTRNIDKDTPEERRFGLKLSKVLVKGDDWNISFQVVKSPVKAVKGRQYASFQLNYEDKETNSFYVICTSEGVESFVQPGYEKYVKMTLKKQVIRIYPSAEDPKRKTVFEMLVECDPNGSIPHSFYNLAIRKQTEFGVGLRALFEQEVKGKKKTHKE